MLQFGCGWQQKHQVATLLPLPQLGCEGEQKENRQKLVGRDKGGLTEQQTKGTVTTTIQIRRIHKTKQQNTESKLSPPAAHSRAATPFHRPSPPTRTRQDGTWCGVPCSVWSGWVSLSGYVPSWLLVKINPVLAEPRTLELR